MSTRNRHTWTAEQTACLQQHYATIPGPELAAALGVPLAVVYNKAWQLGLKKSPNTIADMARKAMQNPAHPARATQLRPGNQPWNKGIQGSTGTHANSRATQFKPGRLPTEARNYMPVGSLRISKDGYLERKTNDTHPVPARRWVAVHRLVWEAAHGPIPAGHIVAFKPGMRTIVEAEVTAERLECISKADNLLRNHPRTKHPELGRLVQLKGAITRQVNRITREHKEQEGQTA
jgi:hypothetical protein